MRQNWHFPTTILPPPPSQSQNIPSPQSFSKEKGTRNYVFWGRTRIRVLVGGIDFKHLRARKRPKMFQGDVRCFETRTKIIVLRTFNFSMSLSLIRVIIGHPGAVNQAVSKLT